MSNIAKKKRIQTCLTPNTIAVAVAVAVARCDSHPSHSQSNPVYQSVVKPKRFTRYRKKNIKKNMDDEHGKKHILKIITINVLFSSARA